MQIAAQTHDETLVEPNPVNPVDEFFVRTKAGTKVRLLGPSTLTDMVDIQTEHWKGSLLVSDIDPTTENLETLEKMRKATPVAPKPTQREVELPEAPKGISLEVIDVTPELNTKLEPTDEIAPEQEPRAEVPTKIEPAAQPTTPENVPEDIEQGVTLAIEEDVTALGIMGETLSPEEAVDCERTIEEIEKDETPVEILPVAPSDPYTEKLEVTAAPVTIEESPTPELAQQAEPKTPEAETPQDSAEGVVIDLPPQDLPALGDLKPTDTIQVEQETPVVAPTERAVDSTQEGQNAGVFTPKSVLELAEKLGGKNALAQAAGKEPQYATYWLKTNRFPSYLQASVIEAAKARGLTLDLSQIPTTTNQGKAKAKNEGKVQTEPASLKSFADVVKALGGNVKCAEALGKTSQNVHYWTKQNRLPPEVKTQVAALLTAQGLDPDISFIKDVQTKTPKAPKAEKPTSEAQKPETIPAPAAETPAQNPELKPFAPKSVAELAETLGGKTALATAVGKKQGHAHYWVKQDKFPSLLKEALKEACRKRGIDLDMSGLTETQKQIH